MSIIAQQNKNTYNKEEIEMTSERTLYKNLMSLLVNSDQYTDHLNDEVKEIAQKLLTTPFENMSLLQQARLSHNVNELINDK